MLVALAIAGCPHRPQSASVRNSSDLTAPYSLLTFYRAAPYGPLAGSFVGSIAGSRGNVMRFYVIREVRPRWYALED